MDKKQSAVVVLCLLLISAVLSYGQGYGVEWNGYLHVDNRLGLNRDYEFSWQECRLNLELKLKLFEKVKLYSEVWLRSWGFPIVQSSSDLLNKDKISPWNLAFREAYLDLYGFISDNFDLRIGKQRIAWGTADKFNPTDNLNPPDLEDIWDFGRHLGADGIKGSYYLGDFTFTGVYVPIFTPAVLPRGDWSAVLSPPMGLPDGLTLRNLTDSITMPAYNPEESSTVGIKAANKIFGFDFSFSYVYGRDYLPLANKIVFTPTSVPGEVDIHSELVFPRMHILGMDMAGSIIDIGIWAEAAVFFPKEIEMVIDLSALGMGIQDSIALADDPYVKYVIGADYTFKNGIYINGQYLHGFVHERGEGNLADYFIFSIEKKFFNEELKITTGGGAEIEDFSDFKNNYAYIFSPEIGYYPIDNTEIKIGIMLIDGTDNTTFGRVKESDEVYLKVNYSF
ncbi:MAG TPA: hypothetical protein ENI34_04565 [candidate division WOR-3 bacterium]|uniref:DUF1302 family protein n=1 Tax=candidate division WOR-3 bacterium TaxID=2052148 RepID=A0A9C9JZY9_UNCW3|nr:hypothetical protein [candidate division WOR-3 bacterium]